MTEPDLPDGTVFVTHPHGSGDMKIVRRDKKWMVVATFMCDTLIAARGKIAEIEVAITEKDKMGRGGPF